MKKLIFVFSFLLVAMVARAETVYLKSGDVVTGKIVEKDSARVLMNVNGSTVTYYTDEINRVVEDAVIPQAVAAPAVAVNAATTAVSAAKHDLIMQFIDVFGTRASMRANFDQMMSSLGPDDAAKLRTAFNVDAIIEELVPLYDKYFTESDLKAYIDFYGSQDGKKLVTAIPQIMRGSVEISAKYFESHMPEEFKKAAVDAAAGVPDTSK